MNIEKRMDEGEKERISAESINTQSMQDGRNDWYGELGSETEWSAAAGRWSWLNPCPEYCTNCGREVDTIAERSPVASINKINGWGSPRPLTSTLCFSAFQENGMETTLVKQKENPPLDIPSLRLSVASWMSGSI